MEFAANIMSHLRQAKTHLCLGIDPPLSLAEKNPSLKIPTFFWDQWRKNDRVGWLERYGTALLEASKGLVPAVKPQAAYFEALGYEGFRVLGGLVKKAREFGFLTILDVKRGDIATTMEAYGHMAFEAFGADSMTVTAYMGMDVIRPLIPWMQRGKGVYVVWISSNPSGGEIQNLCAPKLLQSLVEFSRENEVNTSLGVVYGATKLPLIGGTFESELNKFNLLMPGIGAQGGQVTESLTGLLKIHPTALVPQSRSLGQLENQDDEDEPRSWDDFSELVARRIHRASQALPFGC